MNKLHVKSARSARRKVIREYGDFFSLVSEMLFRDDPIGINFDHNTDEYDAEAGSIIPRLRECFSKDQAIDVVHEEFVRWFDKSTAGPRSRYESIAGEIWELWNLRYPR